VEYAEANDYLLITKDRKLANVASFHGIRHLHLSEPLIAKMLVKKLTEEY
jgi:rRNA-processing protein FCF1